MASTELKVPSDPKHCFFFDLPVEIRIKIYKYCLVFDEVVEIKQIEHTRTAREHHATCTLEVPLKSSRMLTSGRASFRKKFTRRFYDEKVPRHTICCEPEESFMLDSPVEIHYFQGPETVLSLTETCKLLFEEALPIFFAYNTLHLEFRILADYLRNKETGNRGRFIRGLEKIDIWISTHTECTIEFLHSCHDLQSLTLNFLVTEPDESEKKFGLEKLIVAIFTSLAFVRGLKHLSLRGEQMLVRIDESTGEEIWKRVDINGKGGRGPELKAQMLRPRIAQDDVELMRFKEKFSKEMKSIDENLWKEKTEALSH